MKKLFAFLLACMMLLSVTTAFAASAYTPVSFTEENAPVVKHKLTLTNEGATSLPYTITYHFHVGDPVVDEPSDITNPGLAVIGSPTINDLEYTPTDTFTGKVCEKALDINWSGVEFKEPGVYKWEVKKSVEINDTTGNTDDVPSNNSESTYLFAYVIDHDGELKIQNASLSTNVALTAKANLNDEYPAKKLSLTIQKTVQGNQGSKDQYFLFTVSMKAPDGSTTDKPYTSIGGKYVETVPQTAYNKEPIVNAQTRSENGSTIIEMWLKHGDTATFSGLLYGTSYTISESASEYSVESKVTGDDNGCTADGATVSDTSLEESSVVSFTNTKTAVVPTGIDLQTGAPIMGLLMAAAMMLMLFAGKRKEAAE